MSASLRSVSNTIVGLWAMGCGDARGVSIEGTLANILGYIWICELDELGLEYMGVDGSVGTTGNTVMWC